MSKYRADWVEALGLKRGPRLQAVVDLSNQKVPSERRKQKRLAVEAHNRAYGVRK